MFACVTSLLVVSRSLPIQTVRRAVPSLRLPAFMDTAKVLHQLEYFNLKNVNFQTF